jgi:hypothetical protein
MPKKSKDGKIKKKEDYTKTDWIDWLWPVFSRYIRTRDCIRTTGSPLHGKCVTCGKKYPIGKLQAGHFIPGRTDAILFDETQVHAQCYRCNVKLQGMWHKYYAFMLDEGWTHEDIQQMIEHCDDPVGFTREWFDVSMAYYTEETEKLVGG